MSLITEERRQELENGPAEELVKLVKKIKPGKDDEYILKLVKKHRGTLRKNVFWEVANPDKSIKEKADDLKFSPKTINQYTWYLRVLGLIEPSSKESRRRSLDRRLKKLYTREDLVNFDQRFTPNVLREAINENVKIGEILTSREIADKIGIPKIWRMSALEVYGYQYRAYARLCALLGYYAKTGSIDVTEKDGRRAYELKESLRLGKKTTRKKHRRKGSSGVLKRIYERPIVPASPVETDHDEKEMMRNLENFLSRKMTLTRPHRERDIKRFISFFLNEECEDKSLPTGTLSNLYSSLVEKGILLEYELKGHRYYKLKT